jgi:hypothetical protein
MITLHYRFLLVWLRAILLASNGKFALYRSSGGRLSIEPLTPFFAGRDSLSQILIVGIGKGWSSYQQAAIPFYIKTLLMIRRNIVHIRAGVRADLIVPPLLFPTKKCGEVKYVGAATL